MSFIRVGFVLGVTVLLSSPLHAAPAEEMLPAIQASLEARDRIIQQLSEEDPRAATQRTLNILVGEGIRALRAQGDRRMAKRYETEWNSQFSTYFTDLRITDLGDHRPLSNWLAGFYVRLEDMLGGNVIHQGLLGDVYDMNYAIPVVFAPKADWWKTGVPADRAWVEYRKHFIPFSNVVTYWGSFVACTYIVKKYYPGMDKKVCQEVSAKLRHMMGRHVAPKLSDFVYNRANGNSTKLEITERDLVYVDARQLARELSNGGLL